MELFQNDNVIIDIDIYDPHNIDEFAESSEFDFSEESLSESKLTGISPTNLQGVTTRGRAAAFLVMAREPIALTSGNIPANRFNDVPMSDWAFPAITWAANRGWVGTGNNNFNPHRNVTRQEYAVMLVRAFSTPLHSGTQLDRFTDRNQIASWAEPYVRRAVQQGWIQGFPDGTFRPTNNITRGDAITMTNRAPGINVSDPTPRTITWHGNGGTTPVQWQRIHNHAIGPLPTSTRAGYTFMGWFSVSTTTGGDRMTAITRVTANINRWARWPIWHKAAEYTWVGFWPNTINVRAYTLGTVSNGFQFGTRVSEARNAWANALGITIGSGGTSANAQVRAFGGQRSEIEAFRGGVFPWAGLAVPPTRTHEATILVSNSSRRVYRFSGQSRFYVVERSTASSWTQNDINLTRNVTTHELGHSLGYWGHPSRVSANNQDVMWYRNHAGFSLRQNEIRHLQQIYNRFR